MLSDSSLVYARILSVLAVAVLSISAQAPAVADTSKTFRCFDYDVPRLVYLEQPEYPEEARNAGIEGACILQILVNEKGKVTDTRLLQSAGHDALDEAAIESVLKSRFEWRHKDVGVDRKVWLAFPVEFKLENAFGDTKRLPFEAGDVTLHVVPDLIRTGEIEVDIMEPVKSQQQTGTIKWEKTGQGTLVVSSRNGKEYLLYGRKSLRKLTGIIMRLGPGKESVGTRFGTGTDYSLVAANDEQTLVDPWNGVEWTGSERYGWRSDRNRPPGDYEETLKFSLGKLVDSGQSILYYEGREIDYSDGVPDTVRSATILLRYTLD